MESRNAELKKILFVLIVSILTLAVVPKTSFAIGISPAKVSIDFKPNEEFTYTFNVKNNKGSAADLEFFLEAGIFEPYTKLDKVESIGVPNGLQEPITVTINFPSTIDPPGKHILFVGATERVKQIGTLTARTAIRAPITISVPYPGKYVDAALSASNVEVGLTERISVNLKSRGKEDISSLYADLKIYDAKYVELAILKTNSVSLSPNAEGVVVAEWDTANRVPGTYNIKGTISYDGESRELKETKFNLGELSMTLKDVTTEVYVNEINEIKLQVQSVWNDVIKDVYSKIEILDPNEPGKILKEAKSPLSDFNPWGDITLINFLDARSLDEGDYPSRAIVYYSGKTEVKEYTTSVIKRPVEVKVEEQPVTAGKEDDSATSLEEKDNLAVNNQGEINEQSSNYRQKASYFLIGLILLLVIGNIYVIYKVNRK